MVKDLNKMSYSGRTDTPVLQYLTRNTVRLNLPFILTENKILTIGLPYLKTENWLADSKTEAIRLVDIWEIAEIINIKVQSLTTFKVETLNWNLCYSGSIWIWSISSLDYCMQIH